MKILSLKRPFLITDRKNIEQVSLVIVLLLLWSAMPHLVSDETLSAIEPSLRLLVMFSLISFLMLVALCWWLLQRFWLAMGLPALDHMVVHFNSLHLWQKLGFYFASFALLLLAGIGALIAIC